MRKLILTALLVVVLLLPARVQAQAGVNFDSVIIHLWPEFDRPDMLVMYEFTLAVGTALPKDIDFRIPASAEVAVVAIGQTQDTVTDQGIVYDVRLDGDWQVVAVKNVNGPAIRLEYYDVLQKNESARHYVYEWPGDNATDSLIVNFLQPLDVTDLKLDPESTSSSTGSNGLVQYEIDFSTRAAGQTATLTADYQKTSDRLSASAQQVQPSSPLDNDAQGKVSISVYMPWIVGGAGLLLIVVGLLIGLNYIRSTNKTVAGGRKRHAAVRRQEEGEAEEVRYCPQCGKRAQDADQFCRTCGARLRRDE